MARYPLAVLMAGFVTFGLFLGIQMLVSNKVVHFPDIREFEGVEFTRYKRDEQVEEKKRVIKPPKPEVLQQPQMQQTFQKIDQSKTLAIPVPKIEFSQNFQSGPALDNIPIAAPVMQGPLEVGSNIIPLVTVPPQYPRRARMRRIEGHVTLSFTITKNGTVQDINVLDSQPEGVFDKEAARAIARWKFKARREGGELVEQRATQTLEFKLR